MEHYERGPDRSKVEHVQGRSLSGFRDFVAEKRRMAVVAAWAMIAAWTIMLVAACVAKGFNPISWAWAHLMDLARAVGGRG